MVAPVLITATLHVEVQLTNSALGTPEIHATTRAEVAELIQNNYDTVNLGRLNDLAHSPSIRSIVVADYTGPPEATGYYPITASKMTKAIAEASSEMATTRVHKLASSRCQMSC